MAARVLVAQASDSSTKEPVAAYERAVRARFEAHFATSAQAPWPARWASLTENGVGAATKRWSPIAAGIELPMGDLASFPPWAALRILRYGWL